MLADLRLSNVYLRIPVKLSWEVFTVERDPQMLPFKSPKSAAFMTNRHIYQL